MTTVSFVMPVRNEEPHIHASLQSLAEQTYPDGACEIIVVDGKSSDGTRKIVDEIRKRHSRIRLLDNPAGIVPIAMNLGIQAAHGEVIIRADGHTIYPADYAANCVKYLQQTGADNVGGPCVTVPADESFGARLVAAILTNPFGVGNARFRTSFREGYVDTVPFGAFRKDIFARIGTYNEKLVRNQDIELNARIRRAGGKIYLTPALTTTYHPVRTFPDLLRYVFRSNLWHIFTMIENSQALSLRHLVPGLFLFLMLILLLASFKSLVALDITLFFLCLYFASGLYFSFSRMKSGQWLIALIQPFATFCFHVSYGAGIFCGMRYVIRPPSFEPIRPGQPVAEK